MRRPYFGYGVILALFVAEIAVTGITFYSFSLFIRAWQGDPDLRWSLTQINASLSVSLPVAFASPLLGRLVDRRGPKLMMLFGLSLIAVAFLLTAFQTKVWHLWALQALIVLGQSAAFIGSGKLVSLWFKVNRGRMMGIAIAGNNAGGTIMAPLTGYLLQAIGWRPTFGIYGIAVLIVNIPLILLLIKDRPEDVVVKARAVGREVEAQAAESMIASRDEAPLSGTAEDESVRWQDGIRTRAFWLISLASFANSVSLYGVLKQLGKHLEIVGIGSGAAGVALGLTGAFGFVGKVIWGFSAEKVAPRYVFAASLVTQGVGVLFLLLVHSSADAWPLYAFLVTFGLGSSAAGALLPLMVVESFGFASYGTLLGALQMIQRGLSAPVPILVGYAVDVTGTYLLVFQVSLAFLAVGTIASALARRPVRREAPDLKPARN